MIIRTTEKASSAPACLKRPACGARGVVVSNHPLGTAAGTEMLLAGGNAVDAAVAALMALTVVEPMMVGLAGGGIAHLRLAGGDHVIVDALSCASRSMHAAMYPLVPGTRPGDMTARDQLNAIGPSSVAVPGNLAGWHHMQQRWGKLPFADVVQPAIRYARQGFRVSPYLHGCLHETGADLLRDPLMAARFMPAGEPVPTGSRLAQPDYAESLELVARQGAAALHGGELGDALLAALAAGGADWLDRHDLLQYRPIERSPIVGDYRGFQVIGPPPPASSGIHVVQMLNILEGFDLSALRVDDPRRLHWLIEAIRIAFADRNAHSGDPAFVDVPVARLTSKAYAAECRARIQDRAATAPGAFPGPESQDTTHVTVADADGNVVSATHTINGLFGARFMVPGTGLIPNNYMSNFDPHPGQALSVAPGKRVPTSMAPLIVCRDGQPAWALGLPGGLRIFPSALQCLVNLIDHRMPLQQAVEAPRLWTHGREVELEPALHALQPALEALGHRTLRVPCIGGGMNAIAFEQDGGLRGAACWRADGTVAALGGGDARPGVRFRLPVP